MSKRNGVLTSDVSSGPKKVMVRLSKFTVDRIDDYAGHTHSSRPDFIIDAVRQYTIHVLRESVDVISHIDGMGVSKQAKDVYFAQQMSERLYPEMDSYRRSREGASRVQDISVLVTMPMGMHRTIIGIVGSTGLFTGMQEFIKVSVEFMFRQMDEMDALMEEVTGFQSSPEAGRSLEEELEQIRRELDGE